MEQYEKPAHANRGFLWEGGNMTQGVSYLGEVGNPGYVYTNCFLAKIPHDPRPILRTVIDH